MASVGNSMSRAVRVQVAVFNVGYRLLWICLMFSGALARAAGIQMALSIGRGHVDRARQTARVGASVLMVMGIQKIDISDFCGFGATISIPSDVQWFYACRILCWYTKVLWFKICFMYVIAKKNIYTQNFWNWIRPPSCPHTHPPKI